MLLLCALLVKVLLNLPSLPTTKSSAVTNRKSVILYFECYSHWLYIYIDYIDFVSVKWYILFHIGFCHWFICLFLILHGLLMILILKRSDATPPLVLTYFMTGSTDAFMSCTACYLHILYLLSLIRNTLSVTSSLVSTIFYDWIYWCFYELYSMLFACYLLSLISGMLSVPINVDVCTHCAYLFFLVLAYVQAVFRAVMLLLTRNYLINV